MRRLLLVSALLVGLAPGASAGENPVFDDETAADVRDALDGATAVQGVCYGVRLDVTDLDTGFYSGTYEASSTALSTATSPGPSTATAAPGGTCRGEVVLQARLTYVSEFDESEDRAEWVVVSDLPGAPTASDLQRLGLRAGDLLDDSRSEQALLNAALALPALTAERVPGVVPLVLAEPTAPPPSAASPTGTPGSDRLREQGSALLLLGLLLAGAVAAVVHALFAPRSPEPGRYGPAWRRAVGLPGAPGPASPHRHPPETP